MDSCTFCALQFDDNSDLIRWKSNELLAFHRTCLSNLYTLRGYEMLLDNVSEFHSTNFDLFKHEHTVGGFIECEVDHLLHESCAAEARQLQMLGLFEHENDEMIISFAISVDFKLICYCDVANLYLYTSSAAAADKQSYELSNQLSVCDALVRSITFAYKDNEPCLIYVSFQHLPVINCYSVRLELIAKHDTELPCGSLTMHPIHSNQLLAIRYLSDELAPTSRMTELIVWDIACGDKGQLSQRLKVDNYISIDCVSWSPLGTFIAVGVDTDITLGNNQEMDTSMLLILDASSGNLLRRELYITYLRCIAFSPDGRYIAVNAFMYKTIDLYSLADNDNPPVKISALVSAEMRSLVFVNDSTLFASYDSGITRMYCFFVNPEDPSSFIDAKSEAYAITMHNSKCAISVLPSLRLLLSVGDTCFRLWNYAFGESLTHLCVKRGLNMLNGGEIDANAQLIWRKRAALLDSIVGLFYTGFMLGDQGLYDEAYPYLLKAAERGCIQSMRRLELTFGWTKNDSQNAVWSLRIDEAVRRSRFSSVNDFALTSFARDRSILIYYRHLLHSFVCLRTSLRLGELSLLIHIADALLILEHNHTTITLAHQGATIPFVFSPFSLLDEYTRHRLTLMACVLFSRRRERAAEFHRRLFSPTWVKAAFLIGDFYRYSITKDLYAFGR